MKAPIKNTYTLLWQVFILSLCIDAARSLAQEQPEIAASEQALDPPQVAGCQGLRFPGEISAFIGIPYAAMPLKRYAMANLLEPDTCVDGEGPCLCPKGRADAYAPACHTAGDLTFGNKDSAQSEDCLALNIYLPNGTKVDSNVPVVVYFHGGGFVMGSGDYHLTTPKPLSFVRKTGAIFVSLNYRLGPAGFLALPEITQEQGTSGTLGLLDQQLAMKWVRKHIGRFGGDPSNVSLMGESAGAFSICYHLVMPSSKGLFQRAILQSGLCDGKFDTIEESYFQGVELARAVGCDNTTADEVDDGYYVKPDQARLACMRRLPATTIQRAMPNKRGLIFHDGVRWFPLIDGHVIPDQPIKLIRQGKFNRADILLGNNANEGSLFLFIAYKLAVFEQTWRGITEHAVPPGKGDRLRSAFPESWSPYHKSRVFFDFTYTCSNLRTAKALASFNTKNDSFEVFLYHFALEPRTMDWPLSTLGAFHGVEMRYLFDKDDNFDPVEREVADQMVHYWARFIHSGNTNLEYLPGYDELPQWPEFTLDSQVYFTFNETQHLHQLVRDVHLHQGVERLNEEGAVFEAGGDRDPYALCAFFDTLLEEPSKLMLPVGHFPEDRLSYVVNVIIVEWILFVAKESSIWLAMALLAVSLLLQRYLTAAIRAQPVTSQR